MKRSEHLNVVAGKYLDFSLCQLMGLSMSYMVLI